MLLPHKDIAGHPGAGSGCSASLIMRPDGGRSWAVLTNRQVVVEPVDERLALPAHLTPASSGVVTSTRNRSRSSGGPQLSSDRDSSTARAGTPARA